METNRVEIVTKIEDYADICAYIKQIESINLSRVYGVLKSSYLAFLLLPVGAECLRVYKKHLSDPYSWLAKAQCLAQAEKQREFAREQVNLSAGSPEQLLWEDAAKKLNYLMESWNKDTALATQQIIQGIETLVNDHIPLSEVQSEIIEFAQDHDVFPSSGEKAEKTYVMHRLAHVLDDAKINSIAYLSKVAKTTLVQAELFLNRVISAETTLANFDVKQRFLFQANRSVCKYIQQQVQNLRDTLNHFPTLLAARMARKLENINIEGVLQRYDHYADTSLVEKQEPPMEKKMEENITDDFNQQDVAQDSSIREEIIEEARQAVEEIIPDELVYETAQGSVTELEKLLAAREQLLLTVMKKISLHRLQLSCSGRVKTCYKKFHLFPVFNQISVGLADCHSTLKDSLHEVKQAHEREMAEEWKKKIQLMISTFEAGLQRIDTYMGSLNADDMQGHANAEVPLWQKKLHDLIMRSPEEDLLMMDACLQRIASLDSPHLRATLIMRLRVVQARLNDMILANMQSWSLRYVDEKTVTNTLNYLGVKLPPHHLVKVAPNIDLSEKKKSIKREDFYANAADYGISIYKNIRAWLDERVST